MDGLVKFFFWSEADHFLEWLFGMALRVVFWVLVLWIVVEGLGLVVLNPQNPTYNPQARGELDSQAKTMAQTNQLDGQRWRELLRSASTECHYRATPQVEYLLSGTLPDEYIQPNTGAIRWYVQFTPQLSMFASEVQVKAGVVNQQYFYHNLVTLQGFKACTIEQAAKARSSLDL